MMTIIAVLLPVLCLLICWKAAPIARSLSIIDFPSPDGGRKTHKYPTPLSGGLAVLVPTLLCLILLAPDYPGIGVIAACAGGMLVLGLLDDRQHISPAWRLTLSSVTIVLALLAAPTLTLSFLSFSFLSQPVFLGTLALPFTALCLLGLQNAVNMADGKNGIVLGMALIWSLTMSLYAGPALTWPLLTLSLSLAVALVFNLRGKLFLGDSGSYSLSVLLGLMSLYLVNHAFDRLSADTVMIWFLWPVLDCLRLIFARALHGRAPFRADRNHLHHYLYDLMPRWWMGLTVYLGMVAAPILLGLIRPDLGLIWALLVLFCYISLFSACQMKKARGRLASA
ncbi:MAG: glycosyltransferase family 4 protein [Rhodothalassiaceae bacterium]